MILFSHPAPTLPVQHTAAALSRAGLLGEFWTIAGQRPHLVDPHSIRVSPHPGARTVASCDDGGSSRANECPEAAIDGSFQSVEYISASNQLDRNMRVRLSRGKFDGVYAYEQGADDTFRAAARLDALRVYDVPLGHWRGARHPILIEEAALEPDWAPTLIATENGDDGADKAMSELTAADLVLVGNSFGLQTLEQTADVPGVIAVASPGAPTLPISSAAAAAGHSTAPGKLRVLYAGPLSQRAGLSYAFRASRELGSDVAFTIIAPPPLMPCAPLRRELDRVRWLATASMEVVRRHMAAADVFLVPAIYDTNSDMILHALAAGLPVIATPHSAAPDLIRHGKDGFIVPIRSAESISAALDALRREPDLRAEMSRQARRRALDHSWRRYEDIVIASVASALAQRGASVAV